MLSITDIRPQPASRPISNNADYQDPQNKSEKKDKNGNSEIRKQQNRIASRKYREKRKRKLQYLQQLIEDGSTPERASQEAEDLRHRERLIKPECLGQRQPPPAPFTLPSNARIPTLALTPENTTKPTFTTSAAPYDSHLSRTSPSYSAHGESRSTSMDDTCLGFDISLWNTPNWIQGVDYVRNAHSRSEEFPLFTPLRPIHTHDRYEQPQTRHLQQLPISGPELHILGSHSRYKCPGNQDTMGLALVSLPSSTSSSPFHTVHYAQAS